jgi:hypothetical protein
MSERWEPPPGLPVLDLCCCHRCSRDLVYQPGILQQLRARGVPTYCPRCQKIVDAERAARPVVPRMRCVHVDYQGGPFSDLVITAVDGDQVTVSVLGFPDWDKAKPILARWWPGIMQGRRTFSRGELLMKGI